MCEEEKKLYGDVFYDGYGRETCGSSVEYLIEKEILN